MKVRFLGLDVEKQRTLLVVYEDHNKEFNQRMNSYLKELADLCSIPKDLTFQCARHTFATTVTLTNGVPIETVSKMLGHKSLKTTQHYAKIVDKKVSEDMRALKQKFSLPVLGS